MDLNPPKKIVFYISVVLAVLGFLGLVNVFTLGSISGAWLLVAAYVLLAAGNVLKGF